jgi:Mg-chelatase subunit ChlD
VASLKTEQPDKTQQPDETEQPERIELPDAALERLAGSRTPYLIGVRHHSPVLAAAVPALLDDLSPDLLLIELPDELASLLRWLGDPATVAPVALGAATDEGRGGLAFYPFADFSPELAAVRWAVRAGVEVAPCDLPLADPAWSAPGPGPGPAPASSEPLDDLAGRLRAGQTGRADDDMWDRMVEAAAPGCTPEQVRRAALAVGWAIRRDATAPGGRGLDPVDAARERWMRARVAAAGGRRVAVLVGAFHAPALLGGAGDPPVHRAEPSTVVTSLVPYEFGLLDSRSGYQSGIRDPQWQQDVYDSGADPAALERLAVAYTVRVSAGLRAAGHPAGPAESREAARLAIDLARLRGLPAPGRGELVEAIETVFAHGELLGRGRAVAAAMHDVFVGNRHGRLAPGTPESGLVPAVVADLRAARLPGPDDAARSLRLDPLRSTLDRNREVLLRRLAACGVQYGELRESGGIGETLTSVWDVAWTSRVRALIAVAGMRGVTLVQAAEGTLRQIRRAEVDAGGPLPAQAVDGLAVAAACGLPGLTATRIDDVTRIVAASGTLHDIIAAITLTERIDRGHVPGTPRPPAGLAALVDTLDAAAVREVDGLAGAQRIDDARALVEVVQRAEGTGRVMRLHAALRRLSAEGQPLIRGAAGAVSVLCGLEEAADFGVRLASWLDAPGEDLVRLLSGALVAAGPLLATGGAALAPLLDRVEAVSDREFVRVLPAVRGGFDALSPAARDRLLDTIRDRGDGFADVDLDQAPPVAAIGYDLAGRTAVEELFPASGPPVHVHQDVPVAHGPQRSGEHQLAAAERWRLILGRQRGALSPAGGRLARALDELYGAGRGEGSRTVDGPGAGGGRQARFPDVRHWRDELDELYGTEVCQQVLGRAAAAGRLDAVLALDPERARPSVELLHTVLSLAGGLPEGELARLRPLAERITRELADKLANRMRPALGGLTVPRPTRRRGGRLDLPATLRANLATARRDADGRVTVIPERPVFRSRARRSMDWRVIVLVDVSGSMEPSTVWAALTGSVLAAVPALRTHFVTFSTEIIDLTEHVTDPLSLLLEVRVGGGTHIAAALRHARTLITVPNRTMVIVVSDFEEGFSLADLLAETRALVETGCRLLGCASLDDQARPRYAVGIAEQLAAAGMPVAALSPVSLARWVAEQVT